VTNAANKKLASMLPREIAERWEQIKERPENPPPFELLRPEDLRGGW
jgi:hypothetical protein